ncbi:MAG: L-threonylcarbamoyladenylate synthase [Chthoniobacterales bacterium]
METIILEAEKGSDLAVELLKKESVVALPTETVYGLAADAFSPKGVASIFEAKERPLSDPLIVHVLDVSWLDRVVSLTPELQKTVMALAAAFWPGPLTLLLPRIAAVPDLVTAGLETVAVRIPSNLIFRKILSKIDAPLAAPSANRFGRISPTTASDVMMELGKKIPLILDGGSCKHGLESTILWPSMDVKKECVLQILRPGPITAEMLTPFGSVIAQSLRGKSPGSLESHYAPRKKLFWYRAEGIPQASKTNIGFLAFSKKVSGFGAMEVLSSSGDLVEAASNLYGALRRLDESTVDFLLVEPVPQVGIGIAIMDRLRRAIYPFTETGRYPFKATDRKIGDGR